MASRDRRLKSQQTTVFRTVDCNPTLLDLLEITTSDVQKTNFIKALLEILPTAFLDKFSGDNYIEVFNIFMAWFGHPGNSQTFTKIASSIQLRKQYKFDERFKKREFLTEIGLDWSEAYKDYFISKVNSAYNAARKSLSLS
jgi:hypothetical protein